jgi:hypothetical protein
MTCICGAAIREGKDVIVISICNKLKTSMPTILRTIKRSPGSLSKGIQINKKINGASLEQEVICFHSMKLKVNNSRGEGSGEQPITKMNGMETSVPENHACFFYI